jgi:hypothetical protein
MLNLLGMGVALGANGRPLQALTLADLTWDRLEAMPRTAPVVVTTPAALDLRHASDQLCLEELVRRAGTRPVRLVARALVPSSTTLLSRLIDMVQAQPGLELWVSDVVSLRYAVSLLGQARARLVPPPLLALAPGLREIGERRLLLPAMLGASTGMLTPGLEARFADPALWWQGLDPDAARRLAPALARVLGFWRAIKAPLLQQAWATALGGWAAAQAAAEPVRTRRLDVALFAAMCARPALVEPEEAKVRDFLKSWAGVLPGLGIAVQEPSRAA